MENSVIKIIMKLKESIVLAAETGEKEHLTIALETVKALCAMDDVQDQKNLWHILRALAKCLEKYLSKNEWETCSIWDDAIRVGEALIRIFDKVMPALSDEAYNEIASFITDAVDCDAFDEIYEEEIIAIAKNDYYLKLPQENGILLSIRMHDIHDHHWLFSYNYVKLDEDGDVELINDLCLNVYYQDGITDKCNMTMSLIAPKMLGQVKKYGMDLSPNSKMFLEMYYEKHIEEKTFWRLCEARVGGKAINCNEDVEGLILKPQFSFPVAHRIDLTHGKYHVPLLLENGSIAQLSFPENYRAGK